MQQAVGHNVIWILGELMLGEKPGHVAYLLRGDQQKEDGADQFQNTVQALQNEADAESPVEQCCFRGSVGRHSACGSWQRFLALTARTLPICKHAYDGTHSSSQLLGPERRRASAEPEIPSAPGDDAYSQPQKNSTEQCP